MESKTPGGQYISTKTSSLEDNPYFDKSLIPWLKAGQIDKWEKTQEKIFKFIVYIPVIITFSFITMLTFYYVYCFLYPCMIGDF